MASPRQRLPLPATLGGDRGAKGDVTAMSAACMRWFAPENETPVSLQPPGHVYSSSASTASPSSDAKWTSARLDSNSRWLIPEQFCLRNDFSIRVLHIIIQKNGARTTRYTLP